MRVKCLFSSSKWDYGGYGCRIKYSGLPLAMSLKQHVFTLKVIYET